MRDTLTAAAILVILVLAAALVAPLFVDWSGRRVEIAQRLADLTGRAIRIDGDIDLQLLPEPYVRVGNVRIGDPTDAVSAEIGTLTVRLALPPLLRGDVRVTAATLDFPVVRIATGAPRDAAAPIVDVERFGIDKLTINQGSVVVRDGNAESVTARIDGEAEITTLAGPIRGSARVAMPDGSRAIRFAVGRIEDGRARVKVLVEDEIAAARFESEGTLVWPADGALGYEGALSGYGQIAFPRLGGGGFAHLPWRFTSAAIAGAADLRLDGIEFVLGADGSQVTFGGVANVAFRGPAAFDAVLSTRQIDLDRLLGEGERPRPQVPQRLVERLIATLQRDQEAIQALPRGTFDISVGSILVGGEAIVGARGAVDTSERGISLRSFGAELPGRSRLEGVAAGQGTRVGAETADAQRLLTWFTGSPAAAPPFREARLGAVVVPEPDGYRLSDASLTLDRSRLTGDIRQRLVQVRGVPRRQISATLRSDLLDIVTLPTLPDVTGDGASTDFELTIEAERVQYREIGAGRISARLTRAEGSTVVDRLAIADLGGASLTASGALTGAGARFEGRLEARRLEAFAALMQRLVPGPVVDQFAARAALLAPAAVTIRGDASGLNADGRKKLSLEGRLGETNATAAIDLEPDGEIAAGPGLVIELANADAGVLLRQLGLAAATAGAPGRLRLEAGGRTTLTALDIKVEGMLAGARLALQGTVPHVRTGPAFEGTLALEAADVAPLARTLLVMTPAVAPGTPLTLRSGVDLRNLKITLPALDVVLAGAPVRGELAFNLLEFGRIAGQLRLGRVDARAFAPLIFGSVPAPSSASRATAPGWRRDPLGPAQNLPLPGDVWIEAERLVLDQGVELEQPKFVFRFERGVVFVDHAEGMLGSGRLRGQATLRRNGPQANLAARLVVDRAALGDVLGGMGLSGQVSGTVDLGTLGETPAALAGNLSGIGRLSVADLAIARLDPSGLARALRGAPTDSGVTTVETITRLLDEQFSAGGLRRAGLDLGISIANGVVRTGPVPLAARPTAVDFNLSADLRSGQLDARAVVTTNDQPKDWPGAPPQAAVLWKGPVAQPQRSLDVGPLVNGLTVLALAREVEKIEALDQDARERAFFNRRLKASQDEQRRREEDLRRAEEARLQEEARLKAEEVRLKAEEARVRAEEARRRAAEDERLRRLTTPEVPSAVPLPPAVPPPIPVPLPVPRPVPAAPLDLAPPAPGP